MQRACSAFVDVPHMFSKALDTKAQTDVPAKARKVTSKCGE